MAKNTRLFFGNKTATAATPVPQGWFGPLSKAPAAVSVAVVASGLVWCPQPIAAAPVVTNTLSWQQPLSKAVPVAQAQQGHCSVPFNPVSTPSGWQTILSAPVAVAKAVQGESSVPFNTLQRNTATIDKWLQPLSIAVPVAQAKAGSAFVPFNTVQPNPGFVGYGSYQQPLSVVPRVWTARQGDSFVPFNTFQINTQSVDKWLQPLSIAVPVARPVYTQASFVALPAQQYPLGWHQSLSKAVAVAQAEPTLPTMFAAPAQGAAIAGMAWFMPLGTVPARLMAAQQGVSFVPFNTVQVTPTVNKKIRPTLFMTNIGRMMGS